MTLPRTIAIAVHALRQNSLRAALTMLGIVIGIAAVIAMVEIGNGSASAIQQTVASMGAYTLIITPGTAASAGVSYGGGSSTNLEIEDFEAILREAPSVRNATPIVRVRGQVVFENKNWVPQYIQGTTPAFLDVRDWRDMSEGEMFTNRDVRNGNKVCVIGQTLVRELFDGESPLGREVRVLNVSLKVVGVLGIKGANMMGMDQDDILLAPWTTVKYRISNVPVGSTPNPTAAAGASEDTGTLLYPESKLLLYPAKTPGKGPLGRRIANIDQVVVAAQSGQQVPSAVQEITALLRERHRLQEGEPDDFSIRDMSEVTKALSTTSSVMKNLLLCVSLISLIVGGVGIMNIMLVSVTERTREIGLRMAVGAREKDIRRQFLVEAVVLCLVGGMLGVLLGLFSSSLVRLFLNWPTKTSLTAIVAAVAVSATVGIVFGYYPARKASKLNPIEALRYE